VAPIPPKAQILTIYGLFAREMDNWLAISDLVLLMADLGYAEQVTRSAASRMKKSGILASAGPVPGYLLTPAALQILADGDARIFQADADPAGGWLLITFSVPERNRSERHILRSSLVGLGFGQVSGGVWVAPRRTERELTRMLQRTGLAGYASLWAARYLGDEASLVRQAWDLDELSRSYQGFISYARPVAARWRTPRPDRDAFIDYTRTVSLWRRLPYLDPGLPPGLLPRRWAGQRAHDLFARLNARLRTPARSYVQAVTARHRDASSGA
jgi:phenylacetic acid degradation operon negative regulatory protein